MRAIPIMALVCLSVCASGCGLVFVPSVTSLPAPPLRKRVVADAVTGKPVDTAEVTLLRIPWSNYTWPYPWSIWGAAPSEKSAVHRLTRGVKERDIRLSKPAKALGDGRFEIEPHTQWQCAQVMFPFGMPLGFVIHHTRQCYLIVSAPQYKTVWVSDCRAQAPGDAIPIRYEFGTAEPPQPGPSVKMVEQGLHIALPPGTLPTMEPTLRPGRPPPPPDVPLRSEPRSPTGAAPCE